MPVLRRDNGVQFAVQTYRELLTRKNVSLLRNEVRILAQNHGEYIRIFSKPNNQLEAVFSNEAGYLLGESIWYHFEKPGHLVYCEVLPASLDRRIILVVVRNGIVYADSVLPAQQLVDELASLITGEQPYEIYLFGDVPVAEAAEPDKYCFEPRLIKSFTWVERPVFWTLVPNKDLELQPLTFALQAPELGRRSLTLPIGIAIVALIAAAIWYHATKPKPVAAPVSFQPAYIDAYGAYKAALATPAPEKQLSEAASVVNLMYSLPGWQTRGITFNGSSYQISLTSAGGSIKAIINWAEQHDLPLTLTAEGASLIIPSNLAKRSNPAYIYDIQQVISLLVDHLGQLLPNQKVSITTPTSVTGYKSVTATIPFNGISPEILVLIGKRLANLPVSLSSITINIQQGGLLDGTIQLTALGS